MIPARYHSNLPRRPRTGPNDGLPAAGVLADPSVPKSIIGVAYPHAHIGGHSIGDLGTDPQPPEVVWRIVLDRTWREGRISKLEAKVTLEGRFVLRHGEFLELAEDAS